MTTPEIASLAEALAGQYAVEREIGRGGMGVVYYGRDLNLDRPVAIKTLPAALAADARVRQRFLREARTAALLSHPNIVPIYRADELGGCVFFAMGFVDGESMAQRLSAEPAGRLPAKAVLEALRDVALAPGYAHAQGVVHRDVKPENILIERNGGRAMVTDFGIARLAEAQPLTATGQLLGTVYYMSPEQISGEPVDGRSDIYSLGVLGFHALSGRYPFDSEMASAVLVAHVTKTAPSLGSVAPDVPAALASIIDRCLAKDPAARFQTCGEMVPALDAARNDVERAAALTPRMEIRRIASTEAEAVWQRAAELQAMTGTQVRRPPSVLERPKPSAPALTDGYSLANVREAGLEAGIGREFLEDALAERGLVGPQKGAHRAGDPPERLPNEPMAAARIEDRNAAPSMWTGAPLSVEYEIVVEGEMPREEFDLLADVIHRHSGDLGNFAVVGRSFQWRAWSSQSDKGLRNLQVSVLPRGGKTVIRVHESFRGLAGALFGGIVGGGGGGVGGGSIGVVIAATHSVLATLMVPFGIVAAAYGTARFIFQRVTKSRREKLRLLATELGEQVAESITRK